MVILKNQLKNQILKVKKINKLFKDLIKMHLKPKHFK